MQEALHVDKEIRLGASPLKKEHAGGHHLGMCLALQHASFPKGLVKSLG